MSGKTNPDDPTEEMTRMDDSEHPPSSIANVRHTLRTPLNHIIGYSEMLIEEAGERGLEAFAADLQKIRRAGKELVSCIDELVDTAMREHTSERQAARGVTAALFRGQGPGNEFLPPSRGASSQAARGRLLVVDDNATNRDLLSRRLMHEGYEVSETTNGKQALEFLQAEAVDLILLDVMMPEMDGYEVLVQLKSNPPWRDIPVIMISALEEIESVVRCIERGAEDYLPKPFDPVLLRARIDACLEKKRLRDQEVLYLKDVAHVTHAAAAVEAGQFTAGMLVDIVKRPDELGQLARVFQRMTQEIAAREEQLKHQIQVLRIEVDEVKKLRQVAEITETDYFQDLREKAKELRRHSKT